MSIQALSTVGGAVNSSILIFGGNGGGRWRSMVPTQCWRCLLSRQALPIFLCQTSTPLCLLSVLQCCYCVVNCACTTSIGYFCQDEMVHQDNLNPFQLKQVGGVLLPNTHPGQQ